jgi:hypothetical protein
MICVENLLANRVKVLMAKSKIRFQIIAFGPLVPGFQKYNAIFESSVRYQAQSLAQVFAKQPGSRVLQHHGPDPRSR